MRNTRMIIVRNFTNSAVNIQRFYFRALPKFADRQTTAIFEWRRFRNKPLAWGGYFCTSQLFYFFRGNFIIREPRGRNWIFWILSHRIRIKGITWRDIFMQVYRKLFHFEKFWFWFLNDWQMNIVYKIFICQTKGLQPALF